MQLLKESVLRNTYCSEIAQYEKHWEKLCDFLIISEQSQTRNLYIKYS